MSTFFGQNPTFNSYHFSQTNTLNQEAIGAVSLTGPGRVTDLNVYWAGDGQSGFTAYNIMWNNGGSIELQSGSYGAPNGSEGVGTQTLNTTSHNYFYTSTHNVNIGFFRDKGKSSVVSLRTGGGNPDGITLTTSSNSPQSMSGAQSFTTAYGVSSAGGTMRAYGHYSPSNIYVRRSGTWVSINAHLKRSGTETTPSVYVRRGGGWTQLQSVAVDGWDDPVEKKIWMWSPEHGWERGIIRDEEPVVFGNYDPRNQPAKKIYTIRAFAEEIKNAVYGTTGQPQFAAG